MHFRAGRSTSRPRLKRRRTDRAAIIPALVPEDGAAAMTELLTHPEPIRGATEAFSISEVAKLRMQQPGGRPLVADQAWFFDTELLVCGCFRGYGDGRNRCEIWGNVRSHPERGGPGSTNEVCTQCHRAWRS